jgi:hypothetical protein
MTTMSKQQWRNVLKQNAPGYWWSDCRNQEGGLMSVAVTRRDGETTWKIADWSWTGGGEFKTLREAADFIVKQSHIKGINCLIGHGYGPDGGWFPIYA